MRVISAAKGQELTSHQIYLEYMKATAAEADGRPVEAQVRLANSIRILQALMGGPKGGTA
jgi:hypothetical protein